MSDLMRRAHELAPYVAEALREVADEATVPDGDEREWTERQKASRQFAVDIADALLTGNLEDALGDVLQAHAEAARDAALEERVDRVKGEYSRQTRETYRMWEKGMEWRDKTKRAEVECERLQDALRTLLRECEAYALNDTGAMAEAREALATPAPEGEPSVEAAGREAYPQAYESDAPHTPHQAHGNALAAFERLCNWYSVPCDEYGNDDIRDPDAAKSDVEIVRQALTASGVPEEVRRLPEKLDQDEQSLWRQGGKRERQMAEGMRRTIKQLRKALASAPANGYKLVPVEPTIEMTVAGGQEGAVADVYRAMIAAAPQRGGEHE